MGGSRIFDWGEPRIKKARDDPQIWPYLFKNLGRLGGGTWPCGPPPGYAIARMVDARQRPICDHSSLKTLKDWWPPPLATPMIQPAL